MYEGKVQSKGKNTPQLPNTSHSNIKFKTQILETSKRIGIPSPQYFAFQSKSRLIVNFLIIKVVHCNQLTALNSTSTAHFFDLIT